MVSEEIIYTVLRGCPAGSRFSISKTRQHSSVESLPPLNPIIHGRLSCR